MEMIGKEQNLVRWLLANPACGRLTVHTVSWRDAAAGECITAEESAVSGGSGLATSLREAARYAAERNISLLLRIAPEIPEACEGITERFLRFLEKAGGLAQAYPNFYSIEVVVPDVAECRKSENRERIIDAYFRDFPNAYKIFPLNREDLLSAVVARRGHEGFGLLIDGDMPVYGTAKRLAEYGLRDMWRKAPVYLRAGEVTEGMLTEAARLHVSGVDSKTKIDDFLLAGLGHRLQIRRADVSEKSRAGGELAVELWIVNVGTAPCYHDASVRLRLYCAETGAVCDYDTGRSVSDCYPGEDRFLSLRFPVGMMVKGKYELMAGIFEKNTGYPIMTANSGGYSDGYCSMFLYPEIV